MDDCCVAIITCLYGRVEERGPITRDGYSSLRKSEPRDIPISNQGERLLEVSADSR